MWEGVSNWQAVWEGLCGILFKKIILDISYISSFLSVLLFASFFFCCLSSCTQRRQYLSKGLVYYCVLVFRRIGEYVSPDLFYRDTVGQSGKVSTCPLCLHLVCLLATVHRHAQPGCKEVSATESMGVTNIQ